MGSSSVLPEVVDGLAEIVRALDFAEQNRLCADLGREAERPVALSLPKFKVSFGINLTGVFHDLGLSRALSLDADFSGMTGRQRGVWIGEIVHRAVIELAEEGVEAAAATVIVMERAISARLQSPEPFVVDRPFLFLVVDNITRAVLFQGRVVDPTTTA